MFCEERLGKIKFRAFPKSVGPRILSLESVDSYLYSRLRDGNGCATRTMEPECLMPSKQRTKFNIITKEWYTNIPK